MTNIKEIIPSLDEGARRKFYSAVELILLVSANYNHISELETLRDLFRGFREEFWEHYPSLLKIYDLAAEIAQAERAIRYEGQDGAYKVDRDYLLESVVPAYCPDIMRHNKHWERRTVF